MEGCADVVEESGLAQLVPPYTKQLPKRAQRLVPFLPNGNACRQIPGERVRGHQKTWMLLPIVHRLTQDAQTVHMHTIPSGFVHA